MINPFAEYPGKVAAPETDYPYGKAQNITTPGDGTGTPWEKAIINDWFGFQAAMARAGGGFFVQPVTGDPDTALNCEMTRLADVPFSPKVITDNEQRTIRLPVPDYLFNSNATRMIIKMGLRAPGGPAKTTIVFETLFHAPPFVAFANAEKVAGFDVPKISAFNEQDLDLEFLDTSIPVYWMAIGLGLS